MIICCWKHKEYIKAFNVEQWPNTSKKYSLLLRLIKKKNFWIKLPSYFYHILFPMFACSFTRRHIYDTYVAMWTGRVFLIIEVEKQFRLTCRTQIYNHWNILAYVLQTSLYNLVYNVIKIQFAMEIVILSAKIGFLNDFYFSVNLFFLYQSTIFYI